MKRFHYALDPLCLAAGTAYLLNRWLVPGTWKGVFLHGYFADCLLIPAALPLLLWLQRWMQLRTDDTQPTWREIILHTSVWAVTAELLAPHLFQRATADPWDVAAYDTGAMLSGLIWHLG